MSPPLPGGTRKRTVRTARGPKRPPASSKTNECKKLTVKSSGPAKGPVTKPETASRNALKETAQQLLLAASTRAIERLLR